MDLSQYLETMKNLPDRFSNLAFWRGVRKLRDEIAKTFEYVDSWGKNIEAEEAQMKQDITNLTGISDFVFQPSNVLYRTETVALNSSHIDVDSSHVMFTIPSNTYADISTPIFYPTAYASVAVYTDSAKTDYQWESVPIHFNIEMRSGGVVRFKFDKVAFAYAPYGYQGVQEAALYYKVKRS